MSLKSEIKVRKKALIITYYWPPAGGPGVQRWLKFVKYLPDFNIEPIVYIPENPNYSIVDKSLLEDVSAELEIIKHPIKEPYRLASFFSKASTDKISKGIITETKKQGLLEKLMLCVRGNFFIPDARKNWIKPSVNYLLKYISENNIDTIITTGPPHSLHLIGLNLKERLGVTWLADFRDPWTTIGYHKQLNLGKRAQQKHKVLESKVLNETDQVIVTSYTTKSEFEKLTQVPISVITNGYDKESTGNLELDSKFTMAHIGSLLSKRNPTVLWQVLSELIKSNKSFAEDFQLNLVGSLSDEVVSTLQSYDLSDYCNNFGYVSHKEAVKFQKKSQVLLLIEIDSEQTKCIIPGKLFEYMVSNRPILAIGPQDSDVEKLIRETNTGNYFLYDNLEPLKNTILKHYNAYKKGELQSHAMGLQKYSRKALTKSLAELI